MLFVPCKKPSKHKDRGRVTRELCFLGAGQLDQSPDRHDDDPFPPELTDTAR